MTWVEGCKLDTVTVNGQTYTYVYNADGQRVKKIHPDGSYIEYYVMDGITDGESHFTATGNKTLGIRYTLDENGTVVGFTMNGVNYYFAKNLQGDVLAVYNASTNELAAQYTYDSWGNVLTATGTLEEINPFRYRSYYYDEETNFYYLQSRYYNPEIGRFLNTDVYIFTGQGVVGYNMFAYCNNSPVYFVDHRGTRAEKTPEGFGGYCYSDAERIIKKNKEFIISVSKKYDVDPCVVAGCIYIEQTTNYNFIDILTDVPFYFCDTSIGIGQVKVSTARQLIEAGLVKAPSKKYTNFEIAQKLNSDDKFNIECVAAYLSVHQEQWRNTYDISGEPAILGTLYNLGARTPRVNPQPNPFGKKVKTCYWHMELLLK